MRLRPDDGHEITSSVHNEAIAYQFPILADGLYTTKSTWYTLGHGGWALAGLH